MDMKLHEVIVVVGSDGGELHDVCDDDDDVFPIMLQISSKTLSKSCLCRKKRKEKKKIRKIIEPF